MKTIFHFHLIVISSVLLSVNSCKNKKNTTNSNTAATSTTTTAGSDNQSTSLPVTNSTTTTPSEEETYRLVVQFYSKGEGIDNTVNEAFVKFLDSYSKKIVYELTNWGREGEIDYCLKLSELSSSEQDEFVKKAKDLLGKSALVHVNESAKCVHKH